MFYSKLEYILPKRYKARKREQEQLKADKKQRNLRKRSGSDTDNLVALEDAIPAVPEPLSFGELGKMDATSP